MLSLLSAGVIDTNAEGFDTAAEIKAAGNAESDREAGDEASEKATEDATLEGLVVESILEAVLGRRLKGICAKRLNADVEVARRMARSVTGEVTRMVAVYMAQSNAACA